MQLYKIRLYYSSDKALRKISAPLLVSKLECFAKNKIKSGYKGIMGKTSCHSNRAPAAELQR